MNANERDEITASVAAHAELAAGHDTAGGLSGVVLGHNHTGTERRLGITADPAAAPGTPEADTE